MRGLRVTLGQHRVSGSEPELDLGVVGLDLASPISSLPLHLQYGEKDSSLPLEGYCKDNKKKILVRRFEHWRRNIGAKNDHKRKEFSILLNS